MTEVYKGDPHMAEDMREFTTRVSALCSTIAAYTQKEWEAGLTAETLHPDSPEQKAFGEVVRPFVEAVFGETDLDEKRASALLDAMTHTINMLRMSAILRHALGVKRAERTPEMTY